MGNGTIDADGAQARGAEKVSDAQGVQVVGHNAFRRHCWSRATTWCGRRRGNRDCRRRLRDPTSDELARAVKKSQNTRGDGLNKTFGMGNMKGASEGNGPALHLV